MVDKSPREPFSSSRAESECRKKNRPGSWWEWLAGLETCACPSLTGTVHPFVMVQALVLPSCFCPCVEAELTHKGWVGLQLLEDLNALTYFRNGF